MRLNNNSTEKKRQQRLRLDSQTFGRKISGVYWQWNIRNRQIKAFQIRILKPYIPSSADWTNGQTYHVVNCQRHFQINIFQTEPDNDWCSNFVRVESSRTHLLSHNCSGMFTGATNSETSEKKWLHWTVSAE